MLSIIIEEQFEIYKDIQVQDIYKLLYQSTFGCEHAIDEKSREKLYTEFEKAEPNKKEKPVELISLDFFRVNIRPCKAYGIKKEVLFKCFYESSKIKEGSIQKFLISWRLFKELNKQKHYFPTKEIKNFEEIIKTKYTEKNQLPIMHHSEQYRKANNPNYRIINHKAIFDYTKKLKGEKW